MAIQTNSTTDFINRITGLLDYNQPYTYMFWLLNEVNLNASTTAYSAHDGSLNSFDLAGHATDGTSTRLFTRSNGGGVITPTGSNLPLGVWNHWCIRRNSSNSLQLYIDGVLDITNGNDISARSAVQDNWMGLQVGNNAPFSGKFAAIKEFNVALTDAEIQAEMWQYLPKISDGRLNDFAPIMIGPNRARALRGNDWTENGTLIDESGPPITWGGAQVIPILPAGTAVTTYSVNFPSLGLSGTAVWSPATNRYESTVAGIQAALNGEIGNSIPVDIVKI